MDFRVAIILLFIYLCAECTHKPSRFKVKSNSPAYDTIVVGTGASGSAAFSKLARHGKRVLALEAADRIGGRVYTTQFGENLVELGAEWIHGRNNSRTYELAMANNIPIKYQHNTTKTYRSDGSEVDTQLVKDLSEKCMLVPDDTVEAMPLGQYMTKQCTEYITKNKPELLKDEDFVEEFFTFLNKLISMDMGSDDWYHITTKTKYKVLDEYDANTWHKYGYKTLFEIMLNKLNNGPGLPKNANIELNKEVEQIIWSEDPKVNTIVKCKDGSTYESNNVIVTVSLGVLKTRYADLFLPSLPVVKVEAISKISMGLLDKVLLSFDQKWWPEDFNYFNFLWKGEDKAKLSNEDAWLKQVPGVTQSMGSDNVLVMWTIGEGARHAETLPDDVVRNKTVGLLRKFLGSQVPEPTAIIKTTWFYNPQTLGSYSFDNLQTPQNPDVREDLAAPIMDSAQNPRVLFAGEATNYAGQFGTVHGAIETGIREANRVLGDDENTIF